MLHNLFVSRIQLDISKEHNYNEQTMFESTINNDHQAHENSHRSRSFGK